MGVAKKKNILTFETLPFPEFLFRKLENSEFIINVSEVMWEKIDPFGTKSMSHAIFSVIVSKIKNRNRDTQYDHIQRFNMGCGLNFDFVSLIHCNVRVGGGPTTKK